MNYPDFNSPFSTRRGALGALGVGLAGFAASSATEGQAATPPTSSLFNVNDFGARPDGSGDNTKAFQDAMNAAHAAGGGIVDAPAGRYHFEGSIEVPHGVTLRGTWTAPIAQPWKGGNDPAGTMLQTVHGHDDASASAFIRLPGNSGVQGIGIHHPRQGETDPPTPYPPAIASSRDGADNCSVQDVFLANSYEGIDFGTRTTGRHFIRNVYGDVFHRGIFVSKNLDVGRIENVHFWPFSGPDPNRPIRQYCQREAVAFEFGRTDWQMATNLFCWGYGTGFKFSNLEDGPTNGSFLSIAADACNTSVDIEQSAPYGLLITNGQFVAFPGPDATMVRVRESHSGTARFSNCAFWGPCRQISRVQGSGTVGFDSCNFVHWSDIAAIQCSGGDLIVRGCDFKQDRPQVSIDAAARRAIVTDNLVQGVVRVDHPAGEQYLVANNVPTTSP